MARVPGNSQLIVSARFPCSACVFPVRPKLAALFAPRRNTKAVGLEQARTGPSAKPTKRRQLKSSLSIGASASGAYHVRSSNAYSVASVAASDAPPAQNGTADDSLQSRHGGGAGMITRKHR